MSNCFGYARVSTYRQAREGLSLEAQEASIKAYALAKGLGEPRIFVDGGVSGRTKFALREAGGALVAAARPGDHIVITKVDRGFRNLADFLHWFDAWLQTGISLHVIDFGGNTIDPRTSIGRMLFRMLAVVAELRREQISESCLEVTRHLASRGMYTSRNVPMGFKALKNKEGPGWYAVPDPKVRALMSQIVEWHDGDGRTHWAIFQHLRALKVPLPHRRAKEWTVSYVWKLYTREITLRAKEQNRQDQEAV